MRMRSSTTAARRGASKTINSECEGEARNASRELCDRDNRPQTRSPERFPRVALLVTRGFIAVVICGERRRAVSVYASNRKSAYHGHALSTMKKQITNSTTEAVRSNQRTTLFPTIAHGSATRNGGSTHRAHWANPMWSRPIWGQIQNAARTLTCVATAKNASIVATRRHTGGVSVSTPLHHFQAAYPKVPTARRHSTKKTAPSTKRVEGLLSSGHLVLPYHARYITSCASDDNSIAITNPSKRCAPITDDEFGKARSYAARSGDRKLQLFQLTMQRLTAACFQTCEPSGVQLTLKRPR